MPKWIVAVAEQGSTGIAGPMVAAATIFTSSDLEHKYTYVRDGLQVISGVSGFASVPLSIQPALAKDLRMQATTLALLKVDGGNLRENPTKQRRNSLGLAAARALELFMFSFPDMRHDPEDFVVQLPDAKPVPPKFLSGIKQLGRMSGTDWRCEAAKALAAAHRNAQMRYFDLHYPEYELVDNLGYPTERHVKLLKRFGKSRLHHFAGDPALEAL